MSSNTNNPNQGQNKSSTPIVTDQAKKDEQAKRDASMKQDQGNRPSSSTSTNPSTTPANTNAPLADKKTGSDNC